MDVNILKHAYKGRSLLARTLNPTLSAPEADTSFNFFAITRSEYLCPLCHGLFLLRFAVNLKKVALNRKVSSKPHTNKY